MTKGWGNGGTGGAYIRSVFRFFGFRGPVRFTATSHLLPALLLTTLLLYYLLSAYYHVTTTFSPPPRGEPVWKLTTLSRDLWIPPTPSVTAGCPMLTKHWSARKSIIKQNARMQYRLPHPPCKALTFRNEISGSKHVGSIIIFLFGRRSRTQKRV